MQPPYLLSLAIALAIIVYLASSCAVQPSQPLKFDVSCVVFQPSGEGTVVINCADVETWKEWKKTMTRTMPPSPGL